MSDSANQSAARPYAAPFASYFDQLAYSNAIAALGNAFCLSVLQRTDTDSASAPDRFEVADNSSPPKSVAQLRSATDELHLGSTLISSARSNLCTTILSATNCVVCGDVSSGKHYGIYACNGCSGFFKRSVRRKLIYRCQSGTGGCTIDKAHRNSCQACRLRKCLQMGMNKDAVQNERQARNSAQIKDEQVLRNPQLVCAQAAVSATHPAFLPRESRSPGAASNASLPSRPRTPSQSETGTPGKEGAAVCSSPPPSISVSVSVQQRCAPPKESEERAQLVGSSSNCSQSGNCLESLECNFDVQQDTLNEFASRLLHTAIQWIKSLPSFSCLTYKDQVTLLEKSWCELFVLHVIQWSMPLESVPLFSVADSFHAQLLSLEEGHSQRSLAAEAREDVAFLQSLFYRVKRLQIDAVEFVCLKSLVVYKSDVKGLLDSILVEQLQEQTLLVLSQHCRSQLAGQSARFGKLLLLIVALREVAASRLERHLFGSKLKNSPIAKYLNEGSKV